MEIRSIRVSSELKGYSDWPGLEQVCEIRRRWQYKGEWHEEVRYGVTSLPATVAIPQRLLNLKRGHWTIENRLHYVKDVTLGEDRGTVHVDNGPKIMATLRVFYHRCSSALQLWSSRSCFASLVSLSLLERISPASNSNFPDSITRLGIFNEHICWLTEQSHHTPYITRRAGEIAYRGKEGIRSQDRV